MSYAVPADLIMPAIGNVAPTGAEAVAVARHLVAARRALNHGLPAMLITNPALDLLLALFIGGNDGEIVTVDALTASSTASRSVMIRWVKALAQEGMLELNGVVCSLSAHGMATVDAALVGVALAWKSGVSADAGCSKQ